MFDYEDEPGGFSPPLFLAQLFVAPLGSLICGTLVTLLFGEMLRAKGNSLLNLIAYVCFPAIGFVLGYMMEILFPRSIDSLGRWIWIPPVCLATICILWDSSLFHRSFLPDYFWPTAGPDLNGIQMFVFTLPAIASCFYSLAVLVASRASRTS